jgi:hypothetical protein
MKELAIALAVVGLIFFPAECRGQSDWSWLKPSWLGKREIQEVEPIELTDEPTPGGLKNPFADWDWRPRPIEWRTPPFLRRMNENNARFWRNTRRSFAHWATTTGEAIRNSSYNTWDALTGSRSSASDQLDGANHPAPSFGGVHEFLARPKLKF